jgi:hypothetical protein
MKLIAYLLLLSALPCFARLGETAYPGHSLTRAVKSLVGGPTGLKMRR